MNMFTTKASVERRASRAKCSGLSSFVPRPSSAFTMVEIAICLAIIGVALVAIIGVLPVGLRTQRDNREETLINQDATVFIEAIRNGAFGLNDLTNYVYAITNYWARYNADGSFKQSGVNGYTYSAGLATAPYPTTPFPINSGTNIIGLLSTPEFTDVTNFAPLGSIADTSYYSNHVVAYVRSVSGPADERPPQDNPIMQADTFAYRILCVNAPLAMDTNTFWLTPDQRPYNTQLAASLRELRLTFLWPQLPNGSLGAGRQTFRTQVAGQMAQVFTNGQWLYFYQPHTFTNVVSAQ